jgi:cell division protein FtsA
MIRNNYICALDLGSSKISASVCRLRRRRITDIYFDSLAVKGMKKGLVVDSIELVGAVDKLLQNLKAKSGINIKFVYANISGQDIIMRESRAVIPLAERGNKVITLSDILRVNDQARILGSDLEEEIIHQVPMGYAVDSKNDILNPQGLYSHKLEVNLFLVCAKASFIQTVTRIINQAGYEIKDLFFSGLATCEAIFNSYSRSPVSGMQVLCDLGADTTDLLVFNNGILKTIAILPLGGDDLTRHIADSLKIPLDLAEDIKRSYGQVGEYSQIAGEKEILIKRESTYKPIQQRLISEIVTDKAQYICRKLKEAVEKNAGGEKIDSFTAVGRTVLLEGFLETLESVLGIPVKLGRLLHPDFISLPNKNPHLTGQKYLTYVTALGTISAALRGAVVQNLPVGLASPTIAHRLFRRVKEMYQEYF